MRFERFELAGRSFTPKVTISKSGHINFNTGARRDFDTDEYEYVVLYFDPDAREIGIELTNDKGASGARKLQHRGGGASVYARSFLDYYYVDHKTKHSFEPRADEETGFLVLGPVTISKRRLRGGSEGEQLGGTAGGLADEGSQQE